MNVAVIGLGKLGAVLAAVVADAGHEVIGIDVNQVTVDAINDGRAPVDETGLQDLMDGIPDGTLWATWDIEVASATEISLVVVPTPSTPDEPAFSADYVVQAVTELGEALRWRTHRHTVVICSTLMPGTMDNVIAPALEKASGRVLGDNLGLCYSPEFIALGSVVKDMQYPDAVLIGANDYRASNELATLIRSYTRTAPIFHELTYSEAELAKIGVNTAVTQKISFANTIAEYCETLPGASAAKVLAAIGSDSRIGHSYLRPGAAFGGPCFPRDNRAFAAHGERHGIPAYQAIATDQANERLTRRVTQILAQFDRVTILGLAYKPGTHVAEESMGLTVATWLSYAGIRVDVHDPQAEVELPELVTRYDRIDFAIARAPVILIATPWPAYTTVDFGGRYVLDAWNCTMPQQNRRVLGDHTDWWGA